MKSEELKQIYNKAKELAITILQQAYLDSSWDEKSIDYVCIEDDGTLIVRLSQDNGCRGCSDMEYTSINLTEDELNQEIEVTVGNRKQDHIAKLAKEAETKKLKEIADKKKAEEAKEKKEYNDYLKLKEKYGK